MSNTMAMNLEGGKGQGASPLAANNKVTTTMWPETTTTRKPATATAAVALVTMQKTTTGAAINTTTTTTTTNLAAPAPAQQKTAAKKKAAPKQRPPPPPPPAVKTMTPFTLQQQQHQFGVGAAAAPPPAATYMFGPPPPAAARGGNMGLLLPPPPPIAVPVQPLAAKEEDFQMSMYHYCLWKHQQMKRNTKKPPPLPSATSAPTTDKPDSPQANSTKPSSPSVSATATTTTTTATTTNNGTTKTTDWGRIVATLEQEIPQLAEFKKTGGDLQLEQIPPPVLAKLYTELPGMYQQVEWFQQRLLTLHAHAMTAATATAMVLPAAAAANNTITKPYTNITKRKAAATVESPRPTGAIDWSAIEKISEDQQATKKFKTAASLLPKGAPKQVVDLVKTLKADARNDRKNASKVIKRLEAKVQDIEYDKHKKLKAIKEALEKKQMAKMKVQIETERAETAARTARISAYNAVPFETRIEQLEHFRKGHGHCDVSTSSKARNAGELSSELAWWVMAVRRNWRLIQDDPARLRTDEYFEKNGNNPSHLSTSRIATLDGMGFRWFCDRKPPTSFEERFKELKAWKEKNGHADVPRSAKGLGECCHMYRANYKAGTLSNDKIKKLESIGFKWELRRPNLNFEERVEECKDWRRKHGHLTLPAPDDTKAAANKEKEDGDGEDDAAGGSNNKGGAKGAAGNDENQTPEEKEEYEKEQSLRRWAKAIRMEYDKFNKGLQCRLNKTKVKQLDNLGFDWAMQEERWKRMRTKDGSVDPVKRRHSEANEQMFDARMKILQQIKDEYGDVGVESRKKFFGEDRQAYDNLYDWIKIQRRMFKHLNEGKWSSLTADRITKLKSVNFDFTPRAHYNYKKKGKKNDPSKTGNDNEEEQEEDDTDDDDDVVKESPPHIPPARLVPEYQQQQLQKPQYYNYQQKRW